MMKKIRSMGILTIMLFIVLGCVPQVPQQDVELPPALQNTVKQDRFPTTEEITSGNVRRLVLDINGLACPSCSATVRNFLLDLPGIYTVEVTPGKDHDIVLYDATLITKEEIINSEMFIGSYSAQIIDDQLYEG